MSGTEQVRLIVNADDFGMTPGVNRAVEELHAAGALTSATLMAGGASFQEAVAIAREQPGLGVGCHVVLVDGAPTASNAAVSSILTPRATLSDSMGKFAVAVQARYAKLEHIQHETAAQIAKLQDAGVNVTHVDTHKHTHMLPRVARAVMQGALSRGVQRIRSPFEPAWCASLSPASLSRRIPFRLLHRLQRAFQRELARTGMQTTTGSLGLIATGSLDAAVLRRILDAAPAGTYELVCHPGYNDQSLAQVRTKLRASREIERDALLEVISQLQDRFQRINYADLAATK